MTRTHTDDRGIELDETERAVLRARIRDARASVREVAAETGIVANRVDDCLARLEATGAVRGYEARVDYDRLGYDVTALLWLSVEGDAAVDRLRRTAGLVTVYRITGDHDVLAVGKFRDTDAMNGTVASLLTDEGIDELDVTVAVDTVREFRPLVPDED